MNNNMVKAVATCPQCGFSLDAEILRRKHRFLIFRCPCCERNVVQYRNRTDTLSDELVSLLIKSRKLQYCGILKSPYHDHAVISADDIINLRILLNTERDSGRIIARL